MRIGKDEVMARVPILNPHFFTQAFFDPDCWDIDTDALFQGFRRSASVHGLVAKVSAGVTGAWRRGALWTIQTNGGTFHAAVAVNASGAWADETAAFLAQAHSAICL